MPNLSGKTRDTTTDLFEDSLGVRTWLLQISGSLKAIFLPQGLLDYRDIPSSESEPASPPAGRIREFWRNSIKQYKNSTGKVVRQLGFAQKEIIQIDVIGKGTGATKTIMRSDNCTIAEEFTIGDKVLYHVIIPIELDQAEDATIEFGWYPIGSESGKLVSWRVEVVEINIGTLVDKVGDIILTVVDETSPSVAFTNTKTTLTLPKVHLSPRALHICIERVASSNDPTVAASPAIHHVSLEYCVR